jgi:mannosylglycerate hydrolase
VPGDGRRPFHLRTPEGRRIPASVEPAGPAESLMDLTLRAAGACYVLDHLPDDFSGDRVRTVTWRRRGDHLDVDLIVGGCGPELDVAAAKERLRGLLASDDVRTARLRAQRPARARLRFVDELPSHGISVYRLGSGPVEDGPEPRASGDSGTGARISNEFFELTAHPDGRIDLLHRLRGVRSDDAVRIVSEGDRGDEYNFDPVPAGSTVDRPERVSVRTHASAAEARLDVDLWYRVPAALRADRAARSARNVSLPVRLRLRLARGLDRVDVDVEVENRARDHRLRLVVGCPFEPRRLRVESAFEVASRPLAPGPDAFGGGRAPAEYPIGAGPQRGFASLDDGDLALTVANRGGGEVEALAGTAGRAPGLALTLLRSVGWLSRGDLALRPGDAGPPLATPDAQVLGDHRLAFAIALHPAEDPAAWDRALRFCAPPLAVWGGTPDPEAPLAHGDRLLEIEDPRLLVSALEPCEGGGVSARLWNASDASVASPIRLAGVAPRSVDLAGRPARDGEVDALELEPWRIATFRS